MKEKSLLPYNRIFGLDLLRASAILMVVFSHLFLFSPTQNIITSQLAPLSGFLGVEILLVLSGFLIGNKVYTMVVLKNTFSMIQSFRYLKQRAWRTLPNYFMVLLLALALAFWFQYRVDYNWKYFFFLQNFAQPMPLFFPESWSITVGFFGNLILIFGMCLIFNRFDFKKKSIVFLIVIVCLIAFSFGFKLGYYLKAQSTTILQWDSDLKSVVIYRLDSFFIGVLCSWIYFNATAFWKKNKMILLSFGLLLMALMFIGVGYFRWLIASKPFFWKVPYLPITSIAIAFLLPVFSQWNLKNRIIKHSILFISKISYAVYLLHYTIILQLMQHFINLKTATMSQFCLFSLVYLVTTLLFGFVLYHFFERPIRNKMVKN